MYNLNPSVMFLASLARSKDHLDKLTSKNGVYLGYVFFLTGSVLHFLGTVTPHWAGGTDGYAGVWYMCNVTGGKDNCHSYPDSETWLKITEIFAGMTVALTLGGIAFISVGVYQKTMYLASSVGTFSTYSGLCSLVSVIFFNRQYPRLGAVAQYMDWSFHLVMAGAFTMLAGGATLSLANLKA